MNINIAQEIRDRNWQQGSLLALDEPVKSVNWIKDIPSGLYLLISQTCDIMHQSLSDEPYIEVLLCTLLESPDVGFMHGRSYRKIHVPFSSGDNESYFECSAINRYTLEREILTRLKPSDKYTINATVINNIKNWVTSRYIRDAFPDNFNHRLDRKALKKIIEKGHRNIRAFCIRLNTNTELPIEEPYKIELILLLNAESEQISQEDLIECEKILERLVDRIQKDKNIEVLPNYCCKCPDQITLHEFDNCYELDFDYISYQGS